MAGSYIAVTMCAPTPKLDVVSVAWPVALSDGAPRSALLSRKRTAPAGMPAPGEFTFTFAVKVTATPNSAGFIDDATAVVVAAAFTCWPPARVASLFSVAGLSLVNDAVTL